MGFYVTAFSDWDEREVYESESFDADELGDALTWASEKASELADGNKIEHLEGAPDFVEEIDVKNTDAVVVVKNSDLL